ncbi:hypothetical protein ACFQS6_00340 [Xanthomonas populi]|uniref:hypothetical protein n=1 Tax=Xanthomonas populi TaxID=53414 RepID=UPI001FC93064|nr:hypothetical protein [Xanthomonas populi]
MRAPATGCGKAHLVDPLHHHAAMHLAAKVDVAGLGQKTKCQITLFANRRTPSSMDELKVCHAGVVSVHRDVWQLHFAAVDVQEQQCRPVSARVKKLYRALLAGH